MKITSKLQLLLFASLPFSFIPSYIAANRIGNLNIEFGLQQVVLTIFVVIMLVLGLRDALSGRKSLRVLARQLWQRLELRLLTLGMMWLSIGAFYSSNFTRALLVLAYAWLIWAVLLLFAYTAGA